MRKIKVSTASEHDTTHFEDVLDPANTNRDILADKGYVDGEREARLSKHGWRMHIQHSAQRQQGQAYLRRPAAPQSLHLKKRAHIEHVFAGQKQMGGKALRSIGLARATMYLNWKVAAYNLQRLVYLKEAGMKAF